MLWRTNHAIEGINTQHKGGDIIAVSHGRAIRAAISHCLKIPLENALNINIDNQYLTVLEHFQDNEVNTWRSIFINKLPE